MRKNTLLVFLMILPLWLSSCYEDDSLGEVNLISKIEAKTELQEEYSLDRWQTLKIKAPEVTQTNSNKPLTYSWEINYKEVSKEKDLEYVCSEFGTFPARLKISNEDGAYYKEFKVNVRYSYIEGLYLLAEKEGKTILSYLPAEETGKEFELDIFAKNNPNVSLKDRPKAICFSGYKQTPYLYISAGSPSVLHRIDANLMTNILSFDIGKEVDYILSHTQNAIEFFVEGRKADLSNTSVNITNYTQRGFEAVFGKLNFASKILYWRNASDAYFNGNVFFDKEESRLIIAPVDKEVKELFNGQFTDKSYLAMEAAEMKKDLVLLLKDNNTNKIHLYWIYPGFYPRYGSKTPLPEEMKDSREVPEESGMKESSLFVTAPFKNLMYYSSDNKIFAYSILSKGNFPTEPIFTLGDGEQVADIYLSESESQMYIATNSTDNSQLQGNIYLFDLDNNKQVWKKANITGKIHKMAYRNK